MKNYVLHPDILHTVTTFFNTIALVMFSDGSSHVSNNFKWLDIFN